jgi:hypothetical protein
VREEGRVSETGLTASDEENRLVDGSWFGEVEVEEAFFLNLLRPSPSPSSRLATGNVDLPRKQFREKLMLRSKEMRVPFQLCLRVGDKERLP